MCLRRKVTHIFMNFSGSLSSGPNPSLRVLSSLSAMCFTLIERDAGMCTESPELCCRVTPTLPSWSIIDKFSLRWIFPSQSLSSLTQKLQVVNRLYSVIYQRGISKRCRNFLNHHQTHYKSVRADKRLTGLDMLSYNSAQWLRWILLRVSAY